MARLIVDAVSQESKSVHEDGYVLLLFVSGLWLMQFSLDVTPLEIMLNGILQGLSVGMVIVPLSG